MSDGQTHGEKMAWKVGDRFRHKSYPSVSPHTIEGKDGDMFVVRWSDSCGRGRMSGETLSRWCEPATTPVPDRTAMLREAYALAKTAGDYDAMARIAIQL